MEITRAVEDSGDAELTTKFRTALDYIRETTRKYGHDQVALSFNGGKDCTVSSKDHMWKERRLSISSWVILHLVRAAFALAESASDSVTASSPKPLHRAPWGTPPLSSKELPEIYSSSHRLKQPCDPETINGVSATGVSQQMGDVSGADVRSNGGAAEAGNGSAWHYENCRGQPYPIRTIYFDSPDAFPEMHQFTLDCAARYGLQLEVLEGDYATALHRHLGGKPVKAIILGTRADDPNAVGQAVYSPSTLGWPCFMRVNPILDWTYRDVWAFLLVTRVPYCSLYDLGYTSIGNIHNTCQNEALRIVDAIDSPPIGNDHECGKAEDVIGDRVEERLWRYRPAYDLEDGSLERAGRIKSVHRNGVGEKKVRGEE